MSIHWWNINDNSTGDYWIHGWTGIFFRQNCKKAKCFPGRMLSHTHSFWMLFSALLQGCLSPGGSEESLIFWGSSLTPASWPAKENPTSKSETGQVSSPGTPLPNSPAGEKIIGNPISSWKASLVDWDPWIGSMGCDACIEYQGRWQKYIAKFLKKDDINFPLPCCSPLCQNSNYSFPALKWLSVCVR